MKGNQTIIFINSEMNNLAVPETKISYVIIHVKNIHEKIIIQTN